MMTSFDSKYQNALRQAIASFLFSCKELLVRDTNLHNKEFAEKCILILIVVKWYVIMQMSNLENHLQSARR